jgi:hypothetical protein
MRKLLVLVVPLLIFAGCTTKNQLLSLTAMSKTAALGRALISEHCDGVKDGCIAAKDAECQKLKDCDVAEKKVYAAVGTLQLVAESAGAVLAAGDGERGEALLAEVVRRLGLIRDILKNWGVKL